MTIDPIIEAVFGPPPADVDLNESLVGTNNAVAIVLLVLATVAVVLRLWVRRMQRMELKLDDWAVVAGLIFNAVSAGLVIATGAYGSGQHVWAVTAEQLVQAAKILFFYTFVLGFCVSFNKLSILLLYSRIFGQNRNWSFRIVYWSCMFFTITVPFVLVITMCVACQPTSFYWTEFGGKTTGTCPVDTGTFFWTYGLLNAVFDFLILALPIPSIMQLQMPLKKRIAVCGIMLLGSFVCITSVVRDVYMYRFAHSTDITWLMGEICVWSSIEPSVGIISACLPNLRPLFGKLLDKATSGPRSNAYVVTDSQGASGKWGRIQSPSASSGPKGGMISKSMEDDEVQLYSLSTQSRNFIAR
ncbi:hypothetical protein GGR56DRAFT_661712 [Xylariaceae sp. FL0804]|nr:hypothetical protein GGR56DRAFT_661712 [Xylariaceae sp. FL0804]